SGWRARAGRVGDGDGGYRVAPANFSFAGSALSTSELVSDGGWWVCKRGLKALWQDGAELRTIA
ncbi:hypothetical protein DBR42_28780, partial [Pelomonas sp. HMWF004]